MHVSQRESGYFLCRYLLRVDTLMQVSQRECGYIVLLCLTVSGYLNADISKRFGNLLQIFQRDWEV